jgi:hypothetical protein
MVGGEEDRMRTIISSVAILALCLSVHAQEEQSPRKLELYDIQDLFGEVGSVEFLADAGKGSDRTGVVMKGDGRSVDPVVLAARALLSPNSKASLSNGILTVRATNEEHRSVRELLDLFRRRLGALISVEARVFQSAAELRKGDPEARVTRLSAEEAEQFQKKADREKAGVFAFPRITLFSGQEGSCEHLRQAAYVSDYDLKYNAAGQLEADPQVDIATAGISLKFRPVLNDAGKRDVLLDDLKISLTEPRQTGPHGEPIFRKIETPFGQVEDPDLRTVSVTLHPLVNPGETLLVGPFSKPWSGKDGPKVWVELRARIVRQPEPAAPKEK